MPMDFYQDVVSLVASMKISDRDQLASATIDNLTVFLVLYS